MALPEESKHGEERNGSISNEKPSSSAVAGETSKSEESAMKPSQKDDHEYPSTTVALTIISACLFSMFLVTLDRMIVAIAIPQITKEFHSVNDIGWYGSAYMLTNCSVQLIYGRLYKFFPVKEIFLIAIALFGVGSAVCGSAPTSNALIVGRAIAGVGSAGIMSGAMQVLVHTVPLEKRPLYAGLFGAVGTISSVLAPVLGGAFTQHVSWRWCFYINLPFSAISVVAVMFLLQDYKPPDHSLGWKAKLARLDLPGTLIFIPSIISLLLALEWGGTTYAWSNWRVILLFVLSGALLLAWLFLQRAAQATDAATVPARIFFQRSVVSAFAYATANSGALMTLFYYLSVWFQAVKGAAPVSAGVSLLPTILAVIAATVLAGVLTKKTGYYWPTMIAAPVLASVGMGLLTTLQPGTGRDRWIGFQVLAGCGMGLGMQQMTLVPQTVLPGPDVSTGIALVFLDSSLVARSFLAVGQTIFDQKLVAGLESVAGADPARIVDTGAAELRGSVPKEILAGVLEAYNEAVTSTLYLSVALVAVMIVPALCIERRSIKGKDKAKGMSGKQDAEEKGSVKSGDAV